LSFSSGVMLFISFVDLMPEAINQVGFGRANLAFFAGMAFFAIVVKFVPEPGPDASADAKKDDDMPSATRKKRAELMHLGLLTAVGISLHNFPEGVAVYLTSLQGAGVGLPLAFAIAAHNIPEGMAVAAPIYHATGSKWQGFKWSLLSGICEPLGALAVGVTLTSFLTANIIKTALAAVAGIMTFMCFHELLPQSYRYIDSNSALISNIAGMMFISFSVWFLQEFLQFKIQ